MLVVHGVNLLASCLIPKLDKHPSSAVHNCLFNMCVCVCVCVCVWFDMPRCGDIYNITIKEIKTWFNGWIT